jgi:hypothetical protein
MAIGGGDLRCRRQVKSFRPFLPRNWSLGRLVLSCGQGLRGRPPALFSSFDRKAAIIAQRGIAVGPPHDGGEHGTVTANKTA